MRIKWFLAVGIIAAAGVAAPGVASAALSDCPSNHMCLWGNNGFRWEIADRRAGSGTIKPLRGDADNEMDSWANRSASFTGCGFGGSNGTGDRQTFGRNSKDDNVAPFNSDEISSWRTANGC